MSVKWRGLRDFQPPSVLIKHARASGGAAIGPHGRGLLGDCGMQRCRLPRSVRATKRWTNMRYCLCPLFVAHRLRTDSP